MFERVQRLAVLIAAGCQHYRLQRSRPQAQKEPLNAQEVLASYETALGPLLRAGREQAIRELEKAGRPINSPSNSKL